MAQPNHHTITNYFKTVVREVRDIPTAFGTELMSGAKNADKSVGNLKKQVKEAAKAIVTGKKGTSSDEGMGSGYFNDGTTPPGYKPGKKR
jgi:hypothetical protein